MFLSLYAIFGELQGPRHRVQLEYVFAVMQFMGFLVIIKNIELYFKKESWN